MNVNKKIIISDYDQTFYINDEDIERNKVAVSKFEEKGNSFIIATLIIVGIELICMYLYPFYITKLTFVQMEYSAMKATISKQIANTLRIFCSFIASPFCTSIGLAVSAIYQLVSMQYIISKNKLNMEMKL